MAQDNERSAHRMSRRGFLGASRVGIAALMLAGPLHALGTRVAHGQQPQRVKGYGPLTSKGDLALPAEFNYVVISRQGQLMSDGQPTPGIFDAMGAFQSYGDGSGKETILIRNHENREWTGEQKVIVPPALEYDSLAFGGNTRLVVRRHADGAPYVAESFAILGGTSTNCAGGVTPYGSWITCEEVVKRSPNGKKHGYIFEVDANADGPVPAVPVLTAGRFVHESTTCWANIYYQTEDRGLSPDPRLGTIGACFYRYRPDRLIDQSGKLAESTGLLEALKLKSERHANMDVGRVIGVPYPVEWVPVPEPDHEDDTDNRRDRAPHFTPTRIQAQDRGAAYFDRPEGMWVSRGKVYFDCTTGGAANLGQVWEYDPDRETITLIYESVNRHTLENPDNIVNVPQTGDLLLQEDSPGEQHIRGLTLDGLIYDFALTLTNDSEFCGACFDPSGQILFVNQQGSRGNLPLGAPDAEAVTYAIWGPFEKRSGDRSRVLFPFIAVDHPTRAM